MLFTLKIKVMKTRGLLRFFPLLFASMIAGGSGAQMGGKLPIKLHSHGTFHRKGKFKGWMKENRKCSFNKNK